MTFLRGCGGRVVQAYPKVKCVLESKWVGKNGLSAESVIWDLVCAENADSNILVM